MIYYLFYIKLFASFLLSVASMNPNSTYIISNQLSQEGYYVAQFKIPNLSILTYYVQSQGEAYLIDPPLDIQVFKDKAQQRGSTIKYILLTHYHVDYLAGHGQIDIPVIMGPDSKRYNNNFQLKQFKDGESFQMGKLQTTLIHTPGHTVESSCFLLQIDSKDIFLFTGDTLFLGDVGRPSFSDDSKVSKQQLASKLFDSLQKLKKLNPSLKIYPGHTAGSILGKSIHHGDFCTLQNQLQTNYYLSMTDRQQFIQKIIFELKHSPTIKLEQHTSSKNYQGVQQSFEDLLQRALKPLTIDQFKKATQKYKIIDTRENAEGTGLIKFSYWLPTPTLMMNWISMILKPQEHYIIVCDRNAQKQILSQFIRIGYFNCQGFNHFDMKHLTQSGIMDYPLLRNYQQLGDSEKKLFLDIRMPEQWHKTGVVKGAKLFQLRKLVKEEQNQNNGQFQWLRKMQKKRLIVVHCRQGLRSRFAASILLRHKIYPLILSQNVQDFSSLGLKMISPEQNIEYIKQRKQKFGQDYESEQQNKQQKQQQSQNMNRMQIEKCYEECLKNKNKTPEECSKECKDKHNHNQKKNKGEYEEKTFSSARNKNQQQASKQNIVPQSQSKQASSFSSRMSYLQQKFKKSLQLFFSDKDTNIQKSLNQLNSLIQKDSQNSQLYINRSLCNLRMGNIDQAFKDIEKAIQKDYLNPFGYFNLASMNLLDEWRGKQKKEGENKQQMKQQNQQVKEQEHGHHVSAKKKLQVLKNIYSSLSCLYLKKGEKSQEIKDYDMAIQFAPNNVDALVGRSFKRWQNGELKQSYQDVKKANQLTDQKNKTLRQILNKMKKAIIERHPQSMAQFIQEQKPSKQPITSQNQQQKQQPLSINPQQQKQQQVNKQVWEHIPSQIIFEQMQLSNKLLPKKLIGKMFSNIDQLHQNIDKEIQQKIEQWNKLFGQLYEEGKVRKVGRQGWKWTEKENIQQNKQQMKSQLNKDTKKVKTEL